MKKLLLIGLALAAGLGTKAQTYSPISLTGFTADIIANGSGSALNSTNNDVDNGGFVFVAQNFVNPSGLTPNQAGSLPTSGLLTSAVSTTPGLTFQFAPYTGNNATRILTGAPGTLTFSTPSTATDIYVLLTTASFTGTTPITVTVNFSDGTNQVFTGTSVENWYNGANPAYNGTVRVNRNTNVFDNQTLGPRIYQRKFTLNAVNTTKAIQSIQFANNAAASTGNLLFVFAITTSGGASTLATDTGVIALSNPNSGCVLSNQETITAVVKNFGTTPQSNIPVSYKINNNTPVTEIIPGPLAPNSSINYNFTTKANLSIAGTYTIDARTNLSGDMLTANDVFTKVVNLATQPGTPTISISGNTSICSGTNVVLTATTSNSGANFQWYKDGNLITGATSSTYSTFTTGNYTVTATQNGCSSPQSVPAIITASTIPATPSLTPNGPTTICNGNSVPLTATSSTAGVTFAWFRNGVAITGATSSNYSATTAGEYAAKAVNGGCSSTMSFAILVKVNGPALPVISQNGAVLTSSIATGNQWYKNGSTIAGATGQNYTVTSDGSYTVRASGSGCTSPHSSAINISTTGVTDASTLEMELYPNPSAGIFRLTLPIGASYQITVSDISGKTIFETLEKSHELMLPLNRQGKGIYILKVTSEKGIATRKLIVE